MLLDLLLMKLCLEFPLRWNHSFTAFMGLVLRLNTLSYHSSTLAGRLPHYDGPTGICMRVALAVIFVGFKDNFRQDLVLGVGC